MIIPEALVHITCYMYELILHVMSYKIIEFNLN